MYEAWISLNSEERTLLSLALAAYSRGEEAANAEGAAVLSRKLARARSRQRMIIRLEGGFVEDVQGNPIPVRLYDYDCKDVPEADVDEIGRPCIISEFGPDRGHSI